MERARGIGPPTQAWEAWVLPLYDARRDKIILWEHGIVVNVVFISG